MHIYSTSAIQRATAMPNTSEIIKLLSCCCCCSFCNSNIYEPAVKPCGKEEIFVLP
uniref:Uncharacterized protein n=1 Tax=Manihot esculenta TaxID=3983 RepID=A0A2C9U809_MANES